VLGRRKLVFAKDDPESDLGGAPIDESTEPAEA
jgi:hypothetical protein